MAKTLEYSILNKPKFYIKDWLIKSIFDTDIVGDEDWMDGKLYNIFDDTLPSNVDIEDDVVDCQRGAINFWCITFHGFDNEQENEDNEDGLAEVIFYISLKTGRIYKVKTVGID